MTRSYLPPVAPAPCRHSLSPNSFPPLPLPPLRGEGRDGGSWGARGAGKVRMGGGSRGKIEVGVAAFQAACTEHECRQDAGATGNSAVPDADWSLVKTVWGRQYLL